MTWRQRLGVFGLVVGAPGLIWEFSKIVLTGRMGAHKDLVVLSFLCVAVGTSSLVRHIAFQVVSTALAGWFLVLAGAAFARFPAHHDLFVRFSIVAVYAAICMYVGWTSRSPSHLETQGQPVSRKAG